MTTLPLAGRTVVVTRAGPRAQEVRGPLERSGATVLDLPLTAQVDPADGGAALRAAVAGMHDYAWAVVTSVNAAERLAAAIGAEGVSHPRRVAAVGPATAAALRVAGMEVDLVPSVHNAAGLVEDFPEAVPFTLHAVLFPAADQASETVVDGLRAKGWDVRRVEAYRTVDLRAPEPERLAQVMTADAIVFTASSAVRAFAALGPPALDVSESTALAVCIGPATAEAARDAGWRMVVEAPRASADGIVDAIVGRLGSPEPSGS
jgi:uroporphyrinogen-III synthase